ncbi:MULTISPECIES: Rap1a/Tai family immunity protein [unclassified Pantoea]|uniref:Rap1a/Tai family immunity protein n=1 Tax=unclassified Pantoea TaxID=2630326 RepID=UPI0001E0DF7E|nr:MULTISPECIES: Rap1a/Tai family immunity protein [unclassified Pantoea]EFM20299.1 conserved hypothetical protein [Pantoea sp. aB]QNQ58302.1 hypothetical protein IAI47_16645 [Pantoea sp. MT58]
MIKRLLAVAVLASLVSAPALAINSRTLYDFANGYQGANGRNFSTAYFLGYVASVTDAMRSKLCIPDEETYVDTADKVKKFLIAHPEYSTQDAYVPIWSALQDYYACPRT